MATATKKKAPTTKTPRKTAKPVEKKKPGRPSTYTKAIGDEICRRLSEGEPLRSICRDEKMPHWTTAYDWMAADEQFSLRIARAREIGGDAIAHDCIDIADESALDTIEADDGRIIPNHEVIQRSKLRVETRLKLLAVWFPNKYGNKVELNHKGKLTLEGLVAGDDE